MAKMTRRKCALCPSDELRAIMYIAEEQNFAVHQDCLLFSSGFEESEEQNTGDLDKRFDVASVMKEIKRGKKLLCNFCHKRGATIGCEVKHCRRSYHYFCAFRDDATIETDEKEGLYRLFCQKHIQEPIYYDENTEAMPVLDLEPSCTTTKMTDETVEEENMEVLSEKHDQLKERIEFLKKCKQAGLLNEIFEEMVNSLHLAQEKLMEDNTSEAEYEKIVISLFDCDLFENILRAAHSGIEGKIQELMNTREKLDAQIEHFRDLKETAFPDTEDTDNTSSGIFE
uniref:PHD-type domain-containing protein n=1 Tax=Micrurus carvalhoi TaxID=3147026 RepID=A0A2H6NIW8_9SAUR